MFQTAKGLQPGTLDMSGRSAEVVETLHRRKIDVCCVQETIDGQDQVLELRV